MTIEITKTNSEPGAASLAVKVPEENVRAADERATRGFQSRARLPGFRKGKAPPAVVKKRFADDIRQQALQEILQESWKAAVDQEKLKPIADPHIHNLKWEQGTPVTFEFHVEVKPDLKLDRLGGFTLKRTVPNVTADQVESQINDLRDQKAPWIPLAGEKPKPKDLVNITLAQREGDQIKDTQPYQFVLGEGRAIPDVEEKVMSLLPGETVDATVKFPADFPEEAKRGQSREVRITLAEVKRQELPALDDAFAREVGDFDSVEALRKAVREDLEKEAARQADANVRQTLIEQIVAANAVVAPAPLVNRALAVYAQAYGIPEDRWEQFSGEMRSVAEAQVRRDLILDFVVESKSLAATEAELDAKIEELAAKGGQSAGELYASLEKSKRLRDLERRLTEEKVFTFLLSQSTVESA
ncbi:MAG TPA: trigger factor [Gemmatimonadales bacterium]|nr:trigger factor [Gemmatimonadales bacterium]